MGKLARLFFGKVYFALTLAKEAFNYHNNFWFFEYPSCIELALVTDLVAF